ncbi:inovirus Gp2 family protein [Xanthomonas cannabis]|uniref:inovirus Gp2 family protein n=1 Tax=Xanthomonas cannabis TaxID=1885674 RepID=UPI00141B1F2F|nr:inovirus Gp2 family protein [Xanthomonas cannabis]NIK63509.1 hypothetical protein [Xanthomonas cannabis]
MTSKIQKIVRDEQNREGIAETVIRVGSRNRLVQIPRTSQYYCTDQDSVWFTGTDDHLFKDFTEVTLSRIYKVLLQNEGRPCLPIAAKRRSAQLLAYRLTALGRQLVQCCAQYHEDWAVAYANHAFHPATTVLLRAMRRYAIRIGQQVSQSGAQSLELAQSLERLARFVRRACRTWRFVNALAAHERQAQDNFDSGREFIYHLAGGHSRLLILRIDLYYRPYYDAGKATKEITSFLRWLRGRACKRNLLPNYLGFIIKCENGLVRGMHWHLMVICNGNRQQCASYLTQQLGEVWARRTGQGPGAYHNCWADQSKYDYSGLGVMGLDDWEKMAGLRAALYYMSKQDCVLKASNDKVKNFWRSTIRKKAGKKRGKPRLQGNDLKLLKRMLGGRRSKYPQGLKIRTPNERSMVQGAS